MDLPHPSEFGADAYHTDEDTAVVSFVNIRLTLMYGMAIGILIEHDVSNIIGVVIEFDGEKYVRYEDRDTLMSMTRQVSEGLLYVPFENPVCFDRIYVAFIFVLFQTSPKCNVRVHLATLK
jgi:hypothetical protein